MRVVRSERGLTRQRNRGIDAAAGDVVAFFDDDARPEPDVFARLAEAYADPAVVGATGRVVEPGDHRRGGRGSFVRRLVTGRGRPGTFTAGGYPRRFPPVAGEFDVEFMQGAFLTVRRPLAAELRFDEALTGYGLAEDEDFSYRLSRRGRIRYTGRAVVHHDNAGFAGRDRRAFGRQVVAHRAYLFRKNFPQTPFSRAMFGYQLVLLLAHRLANGDWAGARGLLDGMRDLRRARRRAQGGAVTFVSSHARHGGSERYLERLVDELGDGHVGSIVALEDGPMVERLRARGRDVTVLPAGARLSMLPAAFRLRRHLRRTRGGVVHANGVKAALVCVLAGARPVWVKHDFSWDGWLARLVGLRCREVVGVSPAVVEVFRTVPRVSVSVVPTGLRVPPVDRAAARAAVRALVDDRPGPVLTLVGRFHPVKGHLDLLAAAPSGSVVLFVGDDEPSTAEHSARVREAAEAAGAVVATGRDDALTLLAGSDVAVMPSGPEGFGLVAVEAMAVGTPVVAYAAGALPDVVGDAGLLVAPGDVAALREAIERVLGDDALRERLAAGGRKRASTVFAPDRWVEAMRTRYESPVP
jgi:glycosyltransferase involved in cell wall biosynthesis